jgi:hypothetical protein
VIEEFYQPAYHFLKQNGPMRPEHVEKNTSKHFEQILLKNGEPPHMFFRTARPSLACGVAQVRWAWAGPVHDKILPAPDCNRH